MAIDSSVGLTVYRGDASGDLVLADRIHNRTMLIDTAFETALREFLVRENDDRLGRWRWPENPDYVVYPLAGDLVAVLEEANGTSGTFNRGQWVRSPHGDAASAYFECHLPPAWHDPKPGDVWLLEVDGVESAFYPSKSLERAFTPVAPDTGRTAISFTSSEITGGRRIYPEDAS